jgi:hypothetical protein
MHNLISLNFTRLGVSDFDLPFLLYTSLGAFGKFHVQLDSFSIAVGKDYHATLVFGSQWYSYCY